MNLIEKRYGNRWRTACWRRHSTALHYGGATSCGLAYLVNAGYTRAAAALSVILPSAAVLYYFCNRRSKLRARDLIVITGCNSGLGYSLAMHCRAQGATVLAGVRKISEAELTKTAAIEALEKKGVIVRELDITDGTSIQRFGEGIKKLMKEQQLMLHALVNNAGVMVFGEFEWQIDDFAKYQVDVNLLGTMRFTRELLPIIRKDQSRIIVISSHCANEPLPGTSIYGATKAALLAWATALRLEHHKYGIKVVSFMPGGFVSESNIMRSQRSYFERMQSSMSDEAKEFYGDYFTRYMDYFSQVSQKTNVEYEENVQVLSDPKIYESFNGALLDIYPSTIYRCESWRYFFYRMLFKCTPIWLHDQLVQRFVSGPSWRTNKQ
ncbi:hypothetical protein DMN91_012826 [Ooceraea biroi]|uniref:D-beta-hydroxybutyrate dehydrogenase, mitochondrial n=1 Tax=Ooceraea biroi TaxID=2015173 RepID=A0A026W555_OOCBI|nr:D-beta-hydroxybutyrate dehydrogenase, mitochondrial [Ooceraea biroi]EZA51210.1 D-beta-hydroxybutyrate dehydrogenase, mitochondrial [Ooceraea biroi]RLU14939.1 hypothetical protein DMN91_012826 [Ooceraea biroi]